jgi:ribose transport system ATP-binding protein
MEVQMNIPMLSLRNVNKYFSETFSLEDISLDFYSGHVHSIIGENGSGKSSIIKIISGMSSPDSGEIILEGNPVSFKSVFDARKAGIYCISNDTALFPNLSICENIYSDIAITKSSIFKTINFEKLRRKCHELFKEFNINLDVDAHISKLNYSQQQLIELLKVYVSSAKVVILDEVSSSFTYVEKNILFSIISKLKSRGVAIIYITHIIEEIKMISDSLITVYNGKILCSKDVSDLKDEDIISLLSVPLNKKPYPKLNVKLGENVLNIENLQVSDILNNISFSLKKSEILGITGLMDSGRSTLGKCLFGNVNSYRGNIYIDGAVRKISSPSDAMDLGIAFLPDSNSLTSLFECLNLERNITSASLKRFENHKYLHEDIIYNVADSYIKKLNIKPGNQNEIISHYSSGNQQKAVLARWMMSKSKIYILNEPTRGIDIASKIDVYNCVNDLVRKGASIIWISSDIDEILGMCDRTLVLAHGEIISEFYRNEATKEKIIAKAIHG